MILLERFKSLLLFSTIVVLFIGCEGTGEVGLKLNPEAEKVDVRFASIPLKASNFYLDSTRTDFGNLLISGVFDDPIFGKTTATAYSQFGLVPGVSFLVGTDATLDSMMLNLKVAGHIGTDVSKPQTFSIYQLGDTLFTGVTYLSNMKTPVSTTLLGTGTLAVQPGSIDQVFSMKLTGSLIDTLFQKSKTLISDATFKNFYRGLVIVPDHGNTVLVQFDPQNTNTNISMHYKVPSTQITNGIYKLIFASPTSVKYNHYDIDRTNSLIKKKVANEEFVAEDGNVYLQPATGILPVIDISPYLAFSDTIGNAVINRMEIEIGPNLIVDFEAPTNIRYLFLKEGKINGPGAISNPGNNLVLDDNAYLSNGVTPATHIYEGGTVKKYSGTMTIFSELLTRKVLTYTKLVLLPQDVTTFRKAAFNKDAVRLKIFYTKIKIQNLD
jgi:hypothetical protein